MGTLQPVVGLRRRRQSLPFFILMGYFDSWQSFTRTLSCVLVNLFVYFVFELCTILVKFRRGECNRV